jgi:hypothetical protein
MGITHFPGFIIAGQRCGAAFKISTGADRNTKADMYPVRFGAATCTADEVIATQHRCHEKQVLVFKKKKTGINAGIRKGCYANGLCRS